MPIYHITAFEKKGEKILDEAIEAINDQDAIERAKTILTEKGQIEKTHRVVSPSGKLILFHR